MIAKIRTALSLLRVPEYLIPNERTVRRIALGLFVFFFLLSLTRIRNFTLDETIFHYPNVLNFYTHGWAALFNPQYSAANTPLPYLLIAGMAHIFGPSLVLARIVTAVLSFFSLLVAMRLLKKSGAEPYGAFVLLFYPYFFVNSFVFYAVNYGLFFALVALLILGEGYGRPNAGRYFLAGVGFSLAVLCQQFYLVVPVALVATRTVTGLLRRRSPFSSGELRMAGCHVLLLMPLIVPALLFRQWGGLTHPNFHVHSLAFGVTTVTGILFTTGLMCLPYFLQEARTIRIEKWILAVGAAILLVVYARPAFSDFQGPGLFTGLSYHLLVLAGGHFPWITDVLMTMLTASGMLVLVTLGMRLRTDGEIALYVVCMLLALAYSWNTQIGERHLLALMIFLLLLILPRMRPPAMGGYVVGMAVIGIGYFFYWTFFKYGGI